MNELLHTLLIFRIAFILTFQTGQMRQNRFAFRTGYTGRGHWLTSTGTARFFSHNATHTVNIICSTTY